MTQTRVSHERLKSVLLTGNWSWSRTLGPSATTNYLKFKDRLLAMLHTHTTTTDNSLWPTAVSTNKHEKCTHRLFNGIYTSLRWMPRFKLLWVGPTEVKQSFRNMNRSAFQQRNVPPIDNSEQHLMCSCWGQLMIVKFCKLFMQICKLIMNGTGSVT